MHNHDEHEHHHHDTNIASVPAERLVICPVTGDDTDTREAEKLRHFRDVDGKRIYLCCATCVRLYDESPNQYTPKLFQCPECELHYADEKTTKECETWCREYRSCNLAITKRSTEYQQLHTQEATVRQLVFSKKQHLVDNIWSFNFTYDQPLLWTAGQYIRLEIAHDNPDQEGTKRWFTISSTPDDNYLQITTRVTGTTFKQALATLKVGDTVQLAEQPDGNFVWQDSNKPLVLIAGGIGITPFYSMLKARQHSEQPIPATLIYNGRNKDLPFTVEFDEATKNHSEFTVHYVIGERLTTEKIIELIPDVYQSEIYISGPEQMVESLGEQLTDTGLDSDSLHQDFFPNYGELDY